MANRRDFNQNVHKYLRTDYVLKVMRTSKVTKTFFIAIDRTFTAEHHPVVSVISCLQRCDWGRFYYQFPCTCRAPLQLKSHVLFSWWVVNAQLAGWLAVLGCADTPAPANSWTRRHDNEMTVFCRDDDTRYHVVCRDGRWVGRIGSCSNTNSQQGFTHYTYSRVSHYYLAVLFQLWVFSYSYW